METRARRKGLHISLKLLKDERPSVCIGTLHKARLEVHRWYCMCAYVYHPPSVLALVSHMTEMKKRAYMSASSTHTYIICHTPRNPLVRVYIYNTRRKRRLVGLLTCARARARAGHVPLRWHATDDLTVLDSLAKVRTYIYTKNQKSDSPSPHPFCTLATLLFYWPEQERDGTTPFVSPSPTRARSLQSAAAGRVRAAVKFSKGGCWWWCLACARPSASSLALVFCRAERDIRDGGWWRLCVARKLR